MAWYQPNLHEALAMDRVEEARELIRNGADVNCRDASGRTPLDYCTVVDHSYQPLTPGVVPELRLQKAQLLLDSGADPNLPDSSGWTLVHQCAHNGDLPLLQLAVRKGAKVLVRNHQGHLPVEQAALRGHTPLVRYLELQSCDLRSLCRHTIREAMGKRSYRQLNQLPLPPRLKLFLNYGSPYEGFSATVVPECPWSSTQLQEGTVRAEEVREFISENASEEFAAEHCSALAGEDVGSLVEALQSLYLWESFKTFSYQEPVARPPRYPMRPRREKEETETIWWKQLLQNFLA